MPKNTVNVIILMDPQNAKDALQFNIESKLKINLIDVRSEAEAIGLLVTDNKIDIIIIDCRKPWDNLIKFIKEKPVQSKFIEIYNGSVEFKSNLPESADILERVPFDKMSNRIPDILNSNLNFTPADQIKTAIHINEKDIIKESDLDFCRIKTNLLLDASPLNADIYIRLSSQKYIKLFAKGDEFDKNDQEKYLTNKKVEYLFIKNEESNLFIEKLDSIIQNLLSDNSIQGEELVNESINVTQTIFDLTKKVGFTPDIQNAVKSNADVLIKSLGSVKKMASLLDRLKKNPDQYIAIHSNIVAQMACSIAEAMGWKSDTTFKKITIASLLHDIMINDQEIAKIQTLQELETKKVEFIDADVKDFPTHPIKAAQEAKSFTEIPADVDLIISQHHEKPDGSGFPRKLTTSQISPLAALFIVAHDLVNELMSGETFLIESYMETRKEKYTSGNFKKAYLAIPHANLEFS